MLLTEIRGTIPVAKKKIQVPITRGADTLGSGVQGFVRSMTRRPDLVVKIAFLQKNDAYEDFIRTAMIRGKTNPFFPRIKAVKKYRIDSLGIDQYRELMDQLGIDDYYADEDILDRFRWLLIVVMEKLIPIDDSNITDVAARELQQLYGEELIKKHSQLYKWPPNLSELINWLEHPPVYQEILDNTKDMMFRQALRLLKPLIRRHSADFHDGNIMVRMEDGYPQLVFIDPVWQNLANQNGPSNGNLIYTAKRPT